MPLTAHVKGGARALQEITITQATSLHRAQPQLGMTLDLECMGLI